MPLRYRDEGADELVFYDITASPEGRSVDRSWVSASRAFWIFRSAWPAASASVADAEQVLNAGRRENLGQFTRAADPELIDALSERFGAQCVVVGIDSQTVGGDYRVHQFTGDSTRTPRCGATRWTG